MITPTGNYVTNATAPSKTVKMVFTDRATSSPQSFDSSTDFQSAEYSNVGAWFYTGLKTIKAKLIGDWSIATGRTYGVYLGIQRPDTLAFDYIRLGEFLVDNVAVEVDANQSTITMYDGMYTASKTAYDLTDDQFSTPITLQDLATLVCSKFEWDLDPNFNALPNYNKLISENIWKNISNTKYRDVINEIAQATGTTAILRYDDTTPTNEPILTFVPYSLNAEVMTKANLIKFKVGRHYGNLNQITASRMPQNDNVLVGNETDISANGVTNYSFVNNQIMDDDRSSYLAELYTDLIGTTPFIKVDEITLETEGHGWYEIGDVFTATIDAVNYYPMVAEHTMKIAGGITETIISTIPDQDSIDRQTAGGIIKHIYNTEIKVDKQNQEITSVVSDVATLGNTVSSNYSEVTQQIDNITQTIQQTGGANIVLNSVGYAKDVDGNISFWEYSGTGTVNSGVSSESMGYGAISGNAITMSGDGTFTQRVLVQAGTEYAFGFRAKKNATGSVTVHLQNTTDDFTIELEASTAYLWNELSIVDLAPTLGYLDVVIETDDPDGFYITDLRLINGKELTQWSQAIGEVTNTSVQVTADGMIVRSSVYDGDFTAMTPIEFAGYSSVSGSQERVFYLNRDETYAKKLKAEAQITMPPFKIVPILTGDRAGWAFVAVQ